MSRIKLACRAGDISPEGRRWTRAQTPPSRDDDDPVGPPIVGPHTLGKPVFERHHLDHGIRVDGAADVRGQLPRLVRIPRIKGGFTFSASIRRNTNPVR
jgi:hypothetical protein